MYELENRIAKGGDRARRADMRLQKTLGGDNKIILCIPFKKIEGWRGGYASNKNRIT